ncbi:hypothetical protein Tco_0996321 [Tanacetum coccineum]
MDNIPPTPHDSPLSGGYTPRNDEGRPEFNELIAICTKLYDRVLDLEKEKDAQAHVDSSDDSLGEENASKQVRNDSKKIEEFNLSDKGSGGTKVFDDTTAAEKDVNAAELVSTAGDAVTAASVIPDIDTAGPSNVSAVGPSTSTSGDIFEDEMMTIVDTLMAIRSTSLRTTSVVIHDAEEEPRRATPVPTVQSQYKEQRIARERAAEQEAKDAALIAKFDNVQERMEANALLAAILQEEEREQFSINEQARFLVETIAERKRYTHKGGKKAESSKKEAASSKKRQKADFDDENVKRQKLENVAEKEGLKAYLKIAPDEDRVVNYETLATKYHVVDWESQIIGSDLQGNDLSYWKIIRADGNSKFYKIFSMMLEDFDRQDLVDLHRLVKERSASRALEGYDLILWGDLRTMFEPSEQDDVWRNQQDWSLISWKLYETCRVHTLLMDEADFENEMAYELIRLVMRLSIRSWVTKWKGLLLLLLALKQSRTVVVVPGGYTSGSDEGSKKLNELTELCTKLFEKVTSLEQDLKQTKQVYGKALTKLVKKVKHLEDQLKSTTKRRKEKVVISDEEEDLVLEDPSKQGRRLNMKIEDLVALWSLVKERFRFTEPTKDMEKALWVELKRLFEPDKDDVMWKLQRHMHDPLTWRLYGSCGVHHISSTRGHDTYMLIEKRLSIVNCSYGIDARQKVASRRR